MEITKPKLLIPQLYTESIYKDKLTIIISTTISTLVTNTKGSFTCNSLNLLKATHDRIKSDLRGKGDAWLRLQEVGLALLR